MTDYSEPLIELRRLLRQVEDACNAKDWTQAHEVTVAIMQSWMKLDKTVWHKLTEHWHVV